MHRQNLRHLPYATAAGDSSSRPAELHPKCRRRRPVAVTLKLPRRNWQMIDKIGKSKDVTTAGSRGQPDQVFLDCVRQCGGQDRPLRSDRSRYRCAGQNQDAVSVDSSKPCALPAVVHAMPLRRDMQVYPPVVTDCPYSKTVGCSVVNTPWLKHAGWTLSGCR